MAFMQFLTDLPAAFLRMRSRGSLCQLPPTLGRANHLIERQVVPEALLLLMLLIGQNVLADLHCSILHNSRACIQHDIITDEHNTV